MERPAIRSSLRPDLTALASAAAAALILAGCSKPPAEPQGSGSATPPAQTQTPPAASPAPTQTPPAPSPLSPVPSSAPVDVAPPRASGPTAAVPADGHADRGIAWRHAASDADVDAAFALARSQSKPVFVYWGAKWCPPCNQVKATLFNRQDFIERSRAFVPVYVDGDSPGAQKLGSRFKVSGYPTMVLFNPQGAELTRLPGEVEAERYTQVLTLGMNAQRPVREVLAQALGAASPGARSDARPASRPALGPNDWRLLAFYSWDTDEAQLVSKDGTPALLKKLAQACPAELADTRTRLRLKALAEVDADHAPQPDPVARTALLAVLADPAASRTHLDVLTNSAADITRALTARGTAERAALVDAFDVAMKRIEADPTLSRADRLTALMARVDLAKIDRPKDDKSPVRLPAELSADVREHTARVDREISDGYERQAVVTEAAYVLGEAGMGRESDAMLEANLARSHSPYYLMSALANNARKRGDSAAALRWYEQAFDRSEGPATRLQWGAGYIGALVDLAPGEEGRIEKAAHAVLAEAASQSDAFYERSGRSLQRVGAKLQSWNRGGAHAAAFGRLHAQLDGVCARIDATDPQRATCEGVLKPVAKLTL